MPTPEHQFARPPWPYDLHATRPVPDLRLLPQDEADRARTRLAELDRACGCTLGAIVALVSLGVYVGLVLGLGLVAGSTWATVGIGVGVFAFGEGPGRHWGSCGHAPSETAPWTSCTPAWQLCRNSVEY